MAEPIDGEKWSGKLGENAFNIYLTAMASGENRWEARIAALPASSETVMGFKAICMPRQTSRQASMEHGRDCLRSMGFSQT